MIHKYNKDFRVNKPGMDFILKLRVNRIKEGTDLEMLSRGRVLELLLQFFLKYDIDYQKLLNMEYISKYER